MLPLVVLVHQVRLIEAQLRADPINRSDLAELLDRLQQQEREKLRLTISWQALRGALAADDALEARAAAEATAAAAMGKVTTAAGNSMADAARARVAQQLLQKAQQLEADAASLKRGGDVVAAGSGVDQKRKQQRQEQQQQQEGELGTSMEMEEGETAAQEDVAQGVASLQLGQEQEPGFCSVKPGFYEQQLAAAAAAAAAGSGEEEGHREGAMETSQGPEAGVCCSHGHDHHHGEHEGPQLLDRYAIGEDEVEMEGQGGPAKPSRAEVEGAVAESLMLLDGVVTEINEVLEEVRYAVAELQEEEPA